MTNAKRARYTLEFKQEAVRLVKSSRSQSSEAKTPSLAEQTLFNWINEDGVGWRSMFELSRGLKELLRRSGLETESSAR